MASTVDQLGPRCLKPVWRTHARFFRSSACRLQAIQPEADEREVHSRQALLGQSQGEQEMSMTDTNTVNNGVNVAALLGAREAMTGAPAAARFTWEATNEWVNGTHSRTTLHDFFG